MQTLNENLLRDLAGHDAPVCLSLFLEVTAGGGDHKLIQTSLKKAKSEAGKRLDALSADEDAVQAVADRLEALDYEDVVGGHDRRLAVFISPDMTEVVDARFEETGVSVGQRFRLSPLLEHLERTPDHAILVASQEGAQLYRTSGGELSRQDVQDMPGSLHDVTKFTDQQEKGNIHGREDSGVPGAYKGPQAVDTGKPGPQGVPHHSLGGHDWREDKEEDLRQYANLVINAAQHHLSGSNVPLVIVADERLNGMLRENCEYPFLAEESVLVHPKEMDEDEIRDAAAQCLDQERTTRRDEAWEKVEMSLGRGDDEASEDPTDIATASASGRVADLFVRAGASLRGHVDDTTLAAKRADDGPEDLVDRAISDTLRNSGHVHPLGDRGGDKTVMAAAYRYPIEPESNG